MSLNRLLSTIKINLTIFEDHTLHSTWTTWEVVMERMAAQIEKIMQLQQLMMPQTQNIFLDYLK